MNIVQLNDMERISVGIECLTNEFIDEYPYYATWIEKNIETFKDGSRVVFELREGEFVVGYMMVNLASNKFAKLNGIHVFPEYQKRGYAKSAIQQLLQKLHTANYDYLYVQTRLHNSIVVHMFEILHFNIIGTNYHSIEAQNNWVAAFDLQNKNNMKEMIDVATKIYPGFKVN